MPPYLRAYRVLDEPALKEFALKSLARILKERFSGKTLLHFEGVPAVLDDYVYLIEALVAAYEVTAEQAYLARADGLMRACMERFSDRAGGFFDTERDVLGTRLKRIEDIPHPRQTERPVMALLKLYHLTGAEAFRSAAEGSLGYSSAPRARWASMEGSYFCALDASFTLLRLTVDADPGSALAVAARALDGPYTVVAYGEDRGQVLPCIGTSCHEPVKDAAGLTDFFEPYLRGARNGRWEDMKVFFAKPGPRRARSPLRICVREFSKRSRRRQGAAPKTNFN